MDDARINILKNETVQKAVNKMAMPAVIGLLVMVVYNLADTMFVAWIGTEAIAATTVVFPLMMVASAIGLSLGLGGGSYISRLLGKNDLETAKQTSSVSFYTGIVIGLVYTLILVLFLEPILNIFGANSETIEYSKDYGLYIVLGSVFLISNMVMNNLLRAEGSAKISMIGMLIGSVLNIILDPIFIFTFGWGVAGAAIATSFSQFVTTMILLSAYLRKKTLLSLAVDNFVFKWSIYKEILVVGVPTFFKQLLMSVSMALLNDGSDTYGGTDLMAATGLIVRISMLPINIVFGIGQGFQPVAGYNIGAGRKDRVMDAFWYTMKLSTFVMVIISAFFIVFGKYLFMAFKASDAVMDYGVKGLIYMAVGLLLLGVINTVTVFYQAIGKGLEAFVMSISRQGFVFIPIILLLPIWLETEGVLLAQPLADVLSFVLALILVIPFIKRNGIDELIKK